MCRTKTQNDNYSPGGGEKKVKKEQNIQNICCFGFRIIIIFIFRIIGLQYFSCLF